MGIFNKKADSYLGVDIGAGGMKLVELRRTKGRPQLWTYAIVDEKLDIHVGVHNGQVAGSLPSSSSIPASSNDKNSEKKSLGLNADPRIDRYAQLLKKVVASARVGTRSVTASLPVSSVFHAILTLPYVPDKELDFHVRAKVKKMLPHPIEQMQVVHQKVEEVGNVASGKQKNIKVLVTAAPREIVSFYTAIFAKAGLQLEELETEAFALERSLVGRDMATSMIVDIGAERTNLFIIDGGAPVTHRTIQIGGNTINMILREKLGVEDVFVNQIKRDISHISPAELDLKLYESTIDPLIKEIQYSFDLFLSQSGNEQKRPEKIILTGGSAVFPPVAELIRRSFPIKVFVGDPWARVVYQQRLKPLLDSFGPRMSVSIGLALRNLI